MVEVCGAVFRNPGKNPLFSIDDRVELIKQSITHIENVQVVSFDGLLIDFVRQSQASVIVRGLRVLSDFEYEFQRALLLKKIASEIETIFMMTNSNLAYISSSAVKELAAFNGDVSDLVPSCVADRVAALYSATDRNGV